MQEPDAEAGAAGVPSDPATAEDPGNVHDGSAVSTFITIGKRGSLHLYIHLLISKEVRSINLD